MTDIFKIVFFIVISNCLYCCDFTTEQSVDTTLISDTLQNVQPIDSAVMIGDDLHEIDTVTKREELIKNNSSSIIETKNIKPAEVLKYARTLIGIPYLYASTDPAKGFDCSGFITNVFNQFNIVVPRSSVDFTNVGIEIAEKDTAPGDLILFTGTDTAIKIVGHMGIVESRNNDQLSFIHSSSGKANGVVVTPFEKYYRSRFVKFVRVFPENNFQ